MQFKMEQSLDRIAVLLRTKSITNEIRTATAPSTGSGVSATKVEKIGVYRDTSSQIDDPETKLLMQD